MTTEEKLQTPKRLKEPKFVFHNCKTPNCNSGWVDEDLTNAQSRPPRWRYCAECCDKYGYVNPEFPPQKKLSEKQKETIKRNQFQKRKKSPLAEENHIDDERGNKE